MNFSIYKTEAPQGIIGLILYSYVIYIFLSSALYSPLHVPRTPFNSYFSVGLLVLKSLNSYLFEHIFIAPSYLEDICAGIEF